MLDAVTEFILPTMLAAKEVSMLLGTLRVDPAIPSGRGAFGRSALAVLFCKVCGDCIGMQPAPRAARMAE
ncbi:hypothetical protein BSZ19_24800 [Bradyrhizobium japonicum]|uniref:Uncharacterized protein n=1 Tax=Bradyrhizobium japonicum TaxID=375 RepID=A0A1Y2JK94_BRAJP|nr:hypothetical protein BSZ19_24800 [Bradyrhizobium japonicum]